MTVSSTVRRAGPFIGNGATILFPFAFKVFAGTDILVVRRDDENLEHELVLGTDYSVSVNTDQTSTPGGVITYPLTGAELAADETLSIVGDLEFTQGTALPQGGNFNPVVVERALDRLTMLLQQLEERDARALKLSVSEADEGTLPPPAVRALKLLGFDSSGGLSVSAPADGSAAALALALASSGVISEGVGQIGYSAALPYSTGLGAFLGYLFGRTAAEIAAAVTPTNYAYLEGDIRRYGALTAAGNNAVAINAALLVSANGGAPAFIPAGTWAYTSTLNATLGCSMYGVGQASILAPNGCNGLTFTNQGTYAGSRFFRDFRFVGTATTSLSGILAAMSAASGNRITGVEFARLGFQGFSNAAKLRGLWECRFVDCFGYRNWNGLWFNGQNIQITVDGSFFQRDTATGAGDSKGVLVDSIDTESTQSLRLVRTGTYEYDVGVDYDLVLASAIENCDISECNKVGVRITTNQGGVTLRDTWVQLASSGAAGVGIKVSPLAVAIKDKVVIDNCNVIAGTHYAGSIGIEVGDNQDAVTVTNNRISVNYDVGIKTGGSDNTVIKHNSIKATTTALSINSLGVDQEVGPNYIENGAALSLTGATPPGFMYFARGSFTMTLTGMAGATTFTMNWVANGRTITLMTPAAGISGTSNTTAMTGTGAPPAIWPVSAQAFIASLVDNTAAVFGVGSVATTGVITFGVGAASAAFTGSGSKGLGAMTATYTYS